MPSVGRIVHLNGQLVTAGDPQSACVAAIVTEVDGESIYATSFTSPHIWVETDQPYDESRWHWPERA